MSAMNADIHPALVRMQAVQDQRKRFEKCKTKFSFTISTHLNNQFVFFVSFMCCRENLERKKTKYSKKKVGRV